MAINSLAKLELELPPSCIAFLPRHQEYCAIGTYYLHPRAETSKEDQNESSENTQNSEYEETQEKEDVEQTRTGSLLLVKHQGAPPGDENKEGLVVMHRFPTDFAILDLQFYRHSDRFCTANSTGSISMYEIILSSHAQPLGIKQLAVHQLWHPKILVLSMSFCDEYINPPVLGATLSNGEVAICNFDFDSTEIYSPAFKIASHDGLEAWTVAFGCPTTWTVFSGGDDAALQKILLQENIKNLAADNTSTATVLWKNRKIHGAGVTAILPINERLVLTGSYDDHARLLDISKNPKVLVEANLDGGVWRLMPFEKLPFEATNASPLETQGVNRKYIDVLACCMHAGTRIIRVDISENPSITVLAKFEENQSMNYGAAARRFFESKADQSYTIVSVSFYDKMVFLWKAPITPS